MIDDLSCFNRLERILWNPIIMPRPVACNLAMPLCVEEILELADKGCLELQPHWNPWGEGVMSHPREYSITCNSGRVATRSPCYTTRQ